MNVKETEKQLNGDFTNNTQWLLGNKLNVHFVEDKAKSVFFASKCKTMEVPKLNLPYKNIQIKQHSKVTYLMCGCGHIY